MHRILSPVRVTKTDSCLTYALKRVGINPDAYKYAKDIPKDKIEMFSLDNVYVGQIIAWESQKKYYLWNTEITTINGKPALIKNNEFAGLHCGVVEHIEIINDDVFITISDCIRNENNHSFPTIGLVTLSLTDRVGKTEVKLPDYYINL